MSKERLRLVNARIRDRYSTRKRKGSSVVVESTILKRVASRKEAWWLSGKKPEALYAFDRYPTDLNRLLCYSSSDRKAVIKETLEVHICQDLANIIYEYCNGWSDLFVKKSYYHWNSAKKHECLQGPVSTKQFLFRQRMQNWSKIHFTWYKEFNAAANFQHTVSFDLSDTFLAEVGTLIGDHDFAIIQISVGLRLNKEFLSFREQVVLDLFSTLYSGTCIPGYEDTRSKCLRRCFIDRFGNLFNGIDGYRESIEDISDYFTEVFGKSFLGL